MIRRSCVDMPGLGALLAVVVLLSIRASADLSESCEEAFESTVALEIRQSSLGPWAGLGVFVASDSPVVPKGTIVTAYGDRNLLASEFLNTTVLEDVYFMSNPTDPKYVRVGDIWDPEDVPGKVPADVPVGHMLNDGANITLAHIERAGDTLIDAVNDYARRAGAAGNLNFTQDAYEGTWTLKATRDLQPGEELFVTYGPSFWLHNLMTTVANPFMRLVLYEFLTQFDKSLFPAGYMEIQPRGRPVMSTDREEPSEEFAKYFVRDLLQLNAMDRKFLSTKLGIKPRMTYRQRLYRMIDLAFGDPENAAKMH